MSDTMNERATIQAFIVAVLEAQADWRAELTTGSAPDHRNDAAARRLKATAEYARALSADDPEFQILVGLPLSEIYSRVRYATRAVDDLPAEIAYLCARKLRNIGFTFIDISDVRNRVQQMLGIRDPLVTSPEGQVLNECVCWFREVSLLLPLFRSGDDGARVAGPADEDDYGPDRPCSLRAN